MTPLKGIAEIRPHSPCFSAHSRRSSPHSPHSPRSSPHSPHSPRSSPHSPHSLCSRRRPPLQSYLFTILLYITSVNSNKQAVKPHGSSFFSPRRTVGQPSGSLGASGAEIKHNFQVRQCSGSIAGGISKAESQKVFGTVVVEASLPFASKLIGLLSVNYDRDSDEWRRRWIARYVQKLSDRVEAVVETDDLTSPKPIARAGARLTLPMFDDDLHITNEVIVDLRKRLLFGHMSLSGDDVMTSLDARIDRDEPDKYEIQGITEMSFNEGNDLLTSVVRREAQRGYTSKFGSLSWTRQLTPTSLIKSSFDFTSTNTGNRPKSHFREAIHSPHSPYSPHSPHSPHSPLSSVKTSLRQQLTNWSFFGKLFFSDSYGSSKGGRSYAVEVTTPLTFSLDNLLKGIKIEAKSKFVV
eukprot:GHVN01060818.1.p1 GENE.GHVN01060818.1~~GHVN01060818.1.p1  ORF type:complete len:409 (-),score=136.37 GHVN01060818.1:105-1331(-)